MMILPRGKRDLFAYALVEVVGDYLIAVIMFLICSNATKGTLRLMNPKWI